MTRDDIWTEVKELIRQQENNLSKWSEYDVRVWRARCEALKEICMLTPIKVLGKVFERVRQRIKRIPEPGPFTIANALYDFHDMVVCEVHDNPPCGNRDPNALWTAHGLFCPFHGLYRSFL